MVAIPRKGDQLELFSFPEEKEDYPSARRLGKWWNTPPFYDLIFAEAEFVRFFRLLVDDGIVELIELPIFIDQIRSLAKRADVSLPKSDLHDGVRGLAIEFLIFVGENYKGLGRYLDELLLDVKERARSGRKLWREEKYWPSEYRAPARRAAAGGR